MDSQDSVSSTGVKRQGELGACPSQPGGKWVCLCGATTVLYIFGTDLNLGRRFCRCYRTKEGGCCFFFFTGLIFMLMATMF